MITANKPTDSLKRFILTVAIPIVAFWTVLFWLKYPLPAADDLFFIGAPINLAKGGEFTNPYIEAWNAVFSSGKFYFQPPFYSFTLAGWLKLTGISTTSLLLFQYLCNIIFSLLAALILRFFGFPRITAFCTTIFFAAWHCNPNPFYSTGFRQDALGMAFLSVGLWLLTQDNWWRYFLGFSLIESAVFTSPITAAYGFSFGLAIVAINFPERQNIKNYHYQYLLTRALALLAATAVVFTLFLLCINFELKSFLTDFALHASFRRTPINIAAPYFLFLITLGYGSILNVPSYILFLLLLGVAFVKRYTIPRELKILLFGLTLGIILNILLYSAALWFSFFFSWIGIAAIISRINWQPKIKLYVTLLAIIVFLSSQSLNILSLAAREYVPESKYREIRETVLANPNRKYAIDEVAARFVFDYKLPKNFTAWNFIKPAPDAFPLSVKDKQPDVTWVVSPSKLDCCIPGLTKDYPRVKFLGRKFNSLPKKPFDVIVIP